MATEATTAAEAGVEARGPGPSGKPVIVVGLDESEHSYHALQWTLERLFPDADRCPPLFSLVVIHAKPSPTAVVGAGTPGVADVWPFVETNLREIAAGVVERAKDLCKTRSVNDVLVEIVEGDARVVLCDAAEKHRAAILVVGSHGYGAFKSIWMATALSSTAAERERRDTPSAGVAGEGTVGEGRRGTEGEGVVGCPGCLIA